MEQCEPSNIYRSRASPYLRPSYSYLDSWCPPCKAIAPVYEELSKKYEGQVAFGKVDVDDNSDAALDFEISAVPTFVLFDGEKAIDKFSGADPAKLEEKVVDLQGR